MLDFRLYAISNRNLVPDLGAFVKNAAEAGLRAFQLREKDLSGKELFELAQQIRIEAQGCKFFVNDRADIAQSSGADGIHLPEAGWPADRIHASFPKLQCGVSVHSLDSALRARDNGADFLVFGPVFETPSKQKIGMEPRRLDMLTSVSRNVSIPVLAIGGMNPNRARQCMECGASGVAVMSDLLTAPNLLERMSEYREALGSL